MKLILLIAILFSSACKKHHPAPVTDARGKAINSAQPLSKQHKFEPKYITVNKGDTLYSIGFSQNMDYKYLAQINNIPAPFRIYPGQKLRLKANKAAITNTGTQATKVKTKPIVIKKPFKTTANTKPQIATTKPVVKPTIKPRIKPISKPTTKPANKPVVKPVVKPISKPVAQAPASNSRWIWPVKGKVISTFSSTNVSRKGIDISSPIGHPVYASNNGMVVYSGDGLLGYGELIIIKHSNNLLSAYAHNSSRLVKEGETVNQGQQIAKSGKGTDGKALLHFEIRKNGQPVNPLKYLPN